MKRWNDDELQKQIDLLKKQLDKHQRKHDDALVNAISALTAQVADVAVAIREGGGNQAKIDEIATVVKANLAKENALPDSTKGGT